MVRKDTEALGRGINCKVQVSDRENWKPYRHVGMVLKSDLPKKKKICI